MIIERLEVEEGFLDDLDITFEPGLNVLIGSRGAGKTSVIELLRYCLGLESSSSQFEARSRAHVEAILGSGRATVTILADGHRFAVTRVKGSAEPEFAAATDKRRPLIFSQGEIEQVGLDGESRLRILDSFVTRHSELERSESSAVSLIRSLTIQCHEAAAEVEALASQVDQLPALETQLKESEAEESRTRESMSEAKPKFAELDKITAALATLAVRSDALHRTRGALANWKGEAEKLAAKVPTIEAWPTEQTAGDPLAEPKALLAEASAQLSEVVELTGRVVAILSKLETETVSAREPLSNRARDLRRLVESLTEGSGRLATQLGELRERIAQLTALRGLLAERKNHLETVRKQRAESVGRLEAVRTARFGFRREVSEELNRELQPRIRVSVIRSGMASSYAEAITSTLRGSNLRYTTLAPALANSLSPFELAQAVENGDADAIAREANISADRARRLVSYLSEVGVEDILASSVEDAVEFELFDGRDYRSTAELSTGQRCTVLLPLLMQHRDRNLIIDQPEDNLDNAFIVDTLIKAIVQRSVNSQVIFASHNANIPVLGDASRVIALGSDGRRGYKLADGELDDDRVVEAITSVMEGGREAFQRRADFYAAHPSSLSGTGPGS